MKFGVKGPTAIWNLEFRRACFMHFSCKTVQEKKRWKIQLTTRQQLSYVINELHIKSTSLLHSGQNWHFSCARVPLKFSYKVVTSYKLVFKYINIFLKSQFLTGCPLILWNEIPWWFQVFQYHLKKIQIKITWSLGWNHVYEILVGPICKAGQQCENTISTIKWKFHDSSQNSWLSELVRIPW